MRIPLVDLKAQYETIKDDIDSAIAEIIAKTEFIGGESLKRFEKNFAAWCGSKHCIGTSNGTASLYVALKALGIKPGDEVITAANTFIATTEAISLAGAKFRLVDVDEKTYNMDVELLRKAITPKTKAIIPVHLYGQPCDMDAIYDIAQEKSLMVLDDAAQAHGAKYKGKRMGSFGTVASFSFFPAKILGCYGDGGGLVTNDDELAAKMRLEVDHGRTSKYEHVHESFNFRLATLQANILNAKLKYLDDWIRKRREIAKTYDEALREEFIVPHEAEYAEHAYYMYVIRSKKRDVLLEAMKKEGVSCGIHYPIPLHQQPAYKDRNLGRFPVAETLSKEILSIPLYPELSCDETGYITQKLIQNANR